MKISRKTKKFEKLQPSQKRSSVKFQAQRTPLKRGQAGPQDDV
jgi:hypothetical protein